MSVDPVLFALLAGMNAQIDVLKVQSAAILQRLETIDTSDAPAREAPQVRQRQALPARCVDMPERFCGIQSEDARIDKDAFGVSAWECRGCGHREELGAGEASA